MIEVRKACCSPVFWSASKYQRNDRPTGGQTVVVPAFSE